MRVFLEDIEKTIIRNNKLIMFLLLCSVLFFITTYPLLNTSFTTTDDLNANLVYNSRTNYFEIVMERFHSVGRILFLSSSVGFLLSKITQSTYVIVLMNLSLILTSLFLFAFLIHKFIDSNIVKLLILVSVAFIPNAWEHNLLLSYPVTFHLTNLLLMTSILLFGVMVKSKRLFITLITYLLCSSLYIITLSTYEVYIVYFPIFFLIFIKHNNLTLGNIVSFIKKTSLMLLFIFFYITFYFLLRTRMPNLESGYSYGGINLVNNINVLTKYSLSTFPGYIYDIYTQNNFFRPLSSLLVGDKYILIRAINVAWLAKLLFVFVTSFICLWQAKKTSTITKIVTIGFALFLILVPNLPIALTSKYTDWVLNRGSHHFLTSFFSYYGIILLLASLPSAISTSLPKKFVRPVFIFSVALVFSFLSLITDYSNSSIAEQQSKVNLNRRLIHSLLDSEQFSKIEKNSVIYAPSFFEGTNIVVYGEEYWDKYVLATKNMRVQFIGNVSTNLVPTYYARIIRGELSSYLVWSKLETASNNYNLVSKDISIYGITQSENINIQGVLNISQRSTSHILVNEKLNIISEKSFNINEYVNTLTFNRVPSRVKSTVPIIMDSIEISPNTFSYNGDYEVSFNEGCYQKESDINHRWVWCKREGHIEVISRLATRSRINLVTSAQTCGENTSLQIDSGVQPVGLGKDKVSYILELQPGINEFLIRSIDGKRCVTSGDTRELWTRVMDYYIIRNE